MSSGPQQIRRKIAGALASDLSKYRRILLLGEMGTGKSTLAIDLLRVLSEKEGKCRLLELDPGTPPFGIPGTVSRARWEKGQIRQDDIQALCTLDAARFRLPLILAARRLLHRMERESGRGTIVLIDPPGVIRGVGGAELFMALREVLEIDAVIALYRVSAALPLRPEIAASGAAVFPLKAPSAARAGSRHERLKYRSRLWDDFLSEGLREKIAMGDIEIVGTPPPRQAEDAWSGRQAAFLDAAGETIRIGEVLHQHNGELALRMVPGTNASPATLVIRDAGRNSGGKFATIKHVSRTARSERVQSHGTPPASPEMPGKLPVFSNMGLARATLVGGVCGDPLVHVRLRHAQQSIFFDLGNPAGLSAKTAHQANIVFLTHAHIDHIGGFTWFLRSRLGPFGPCKIFGPAGTIRRIESFLNSVTWDRIGDTGPVFEVSEIHRTFLKCARLQAGREMMDQTDVAIRDGLVLTDRNFSVRAAICDHNIPSIAYSLLFAQAIKVRKERLAAANLSPGPWLGTLKECISADTPEKLIELPDGRTAQAGELAKDLIIILPGKKLCYAADMADTSENRNTIIELSKSAHTFFCETAFTMSDKNKAEETQHLTTWAAAQMARDARVERLVPFHFSKRYERDIQAVYREIEAAAGPVQIIGPFR